MSPIPKIGSQPGTLKKGRKPNLKTIILGILIFMIILMTVFSILYNWTSEFGPAVPCCVGLSGSIQEYDNYGVINITRAVGGTVYLKDLTFEIMNNVSILHYSSTLEDSNPESISKNKAKIYPIPSNSTPVWDNSTGKIVTEQSPLENYSGCYLAYIDIDRNDTVSVNDRIYIYRDYDTDGNPDIGPGYTFRMVDSYYDLVLKEKF